MKKITFYQSMAASWAAAVALAVALSAGLSACDKDEDPNPDAELYKPAKDMNRAEILALFKVVNANMATVRQMSVELKRIDVITENGKPITSTYTYTAQVNLDAKKELILEYKAEVVDEFTYTEDSIAYYYESDEPNTQGSYKVSDAYWNNCKDYSDFGDITGSVSEWKVEGDAFVGTVTERDATRKYTVFLTSSNKISSVKYEYEYEYSNNEYGSREYKYTYSANPTFPSGYDKSKFPPAKQYSVKVVWGGNLGESTFYSYYSEWYDGNYTHADFYPDEIIRYAPKVAGKKPTLYYDKAFTNAIYSIYSIISLRDNNTVIYVKWVDDSGSTSKSKSKSAAKSRLFR